MAAFMELTMDAAEFIWKAPTLIEHQEEIELAKLDNYFPTDGPKRRLRWKLERRKMDEVWPSLMATSNVFSVLSLFEFHLLRLASTVEHRFQLKLREVNRTGIFRSLEYLRKVGLCDYERLKRWKQVEAAIEIRNALAHASGVLNHLKNEAKIRAFIKSGSFLDDNPAASRSHEQFDRCIKIVPSELGDRIQVGNEYPYILCFFLNEFFEVMCLACQEHD